MSTQIEFCVILTAIIKDQHDKLQILQPERTLKCTNFEGLQDPKGILEDDVLPDGTKVQAGGLVTYVPYSTGRMEYNWGPDATSFNPERWLKEGYFQNASPFKFTAFQVSLNEEAVNFVPLQTCISKLG